MMRLLIILFIINCSCSSRPNEETNHEEAIMIHNTMVARAKEIEYNLSKLAKEPDVSTDSVMQLNLLLMQWESDLVEVPGNKQHDHEGHDHSHEPAPNVTEEQMLEIQKELDARLNALEKRVSGLKPKEK